MKIVAAFDKFKGSLTSKEAGMAFINGIRDSFLFTALESKILELSDGGDGFLASLVNPLGLNIIKCRVVGPLGFEMDSEFGMGRLFSGELVGVIEMASASGLSLVPLESRNPLYTTSKGTGQLIMEAIKRGCTRIFLGVGGSATNDGGLGALQALGLEMEFIKNGQRYVPDYVKGEDLCNLVSISKLPILPASIEISCDVTSPFVGQEGAVSVFSAQKGAGEKEKLVLEQGMINLAQIIKNTTGKDISHIEGAGAAGGIAGGFLGLVNASLKKGIEFVSSAHNLEGHIQWADFVVTGEGCFDDTSLVGKTPSKVIELAHKHNKHLLVVCGEDRSRAEDLPFWDRRIPVLSLTSMFDKQTCLKDASICIYQLVQKNSEEIAKLLIHNKE